MSEETQKTEGALELSGDMLEQLLATATEKAAKREADEALRKGFVTREQINTALSELSTNLESNIVEKITAALSDQVETAVKKAITVDEKSGQVRKGTLLGGVSEDERAEDPVAYLLHKGRELGPESFDATDKAIIWALTHKALSMGMVTDQGEAD